MARHSPDTRYPPGTWHPSEKEVGGPGKKPLTPKFHLEKGAGTGLMEGFSFPHPFFSDCGTWTQHKLELKAPKSMENETG